ncbi:amino acid adenylation domain-containing protein [Pantoea sp. Cy-639]|uniref:amino acid adenylation domain-containing protein n=1 Tax=Pantoea sp. Cy-639 TaxID=2608360 RepID=UPI00141FA0BC|nr:amino acid adenylation domain-containing protein [Pantoea sp. Cy-639]NIF18158.1 amino acid adenylation domain-containing protein [Pantoea sp. Cy-639]
MNVLLPPWSIDPAFESTPAPALGDVFCMPAGNTPGKTAVSDGTDAYTFSELEQHAQTLAKWLHERGVAAGSRVAVLAEKCALMPILASAIWKCGAVYVPLDGAQPQARLGKLIERLQPSMVIALADQQALVPASAWLDRAGLKALLAGPEAAFGTVAHGADDPAYIIFTSGSTGEPKGVEITAGSLTAYFGNHNQVLRFTPDSRVFSLSPFHFDVSIEDTLLPLSLGAFVYQFRQMHAGAIMRSILIREKITHLIAVSTLLTLITEEGKHITAENFAHMEMVMTGAEVCDPGVINLWKSRLPNIRIINAYGPTEATIVCLTHQIDVIDNERKTAYPIGKPLRNVRLKIMADGQEVLAPGEHGELWVGGEQVMRGYFDQPDENDRVLVEVDGIRYYRTGDICCFDEHGNVVFQGRNDDEVKINGRRIHLGEIRQLALSYPGIERAAVAVIHRSNRDCIALVVMTASLETALDAERYLHEQLPGYMHPNLFAWSPTLSISSSGKTDERVLITRLKEAAKLSGSSHFALSSRRVFEPIAQKQQSLQPT